MTRPADDLVKPIAALPDSAARELLGALFMMLPTDAMKRALAHPETARDLRQAWRHA